MEVTKKIFFFILALIYTAFLVNAAPADPVIIVTFDEPVNPTTIQRKLTYSSGPPPEFALLDIYNDSKNITFKYKPAQLLDEGTYTFSIIAEDLYGNIGKTQSQTFTVTLVPFSISIIRPSFGVSAVLPFDVEIRTTRYGNCRYSFTDITYETMSLSFNTNDNLAHTLSNFQSTGTLWNIYVKCKDNYARTYSNTFTLIHDTADPIINSLRADDVFQLTQGVLKTVVRINVSEPAVCKYSINNDLDYGSMTFFPGTSESDINSYKEKHEYVISSSLVDSQTNYIYVICKDRAGKPTSKTQDDFIVNTAQEPIVIINSPKSPYYTSNLTVKFDVTTNKNAECKYDSEDKTNYYSYSYSLSGTGTSHTGSRLFSSGGVYTYYVKCLFDNGDQLLVSTTITIDTTPPTMVYANASGKLDDNPSYSFYTDRLFGQWLAEDNETSISGYKYYVYLDNSYYSDELIDSGETSSTEDWITGLSLNNSKKYYIRVSAKNAVGLWSANMTSNSITVDTSLKPLSCSDGEKNRDETDRDCGGSCPSCINGKNCSQDSDCISYNCLNGNCTKATCSDNKKNQNESSVDCGGPNCAKCSNGKSCNTHTDCLSGACVSNVCTFVDLCLNGQQDSGETDIDCGGGCSPCDNDKKCKIGSDCESKSCKNNVCKAPACDDNVLNGDETGVDCGGNLCNLCKVGEGCRTNTDCSSAICENKFCAESKDKDKDNLPNEWETKYGLDPDNYDTDDNGISDDKEDLDGDGLTNLEEYEAGTNPLEADTDGDGYSDKEEIDLGTNPLDPESKPKSKVWLYLILLLILVLVGAGSYYGYNFYNKYLMERKVKESRPMPKPIQPLPLRRPGTTPYGAGTAQRRLLRVPRAAIGKGKPAPQKIRRIVPRKEEIESRRKSIFEKFGSEEEASKKAKKFSEIKQITPKGKETSPADSEPKAKRKKGPSKRRSRRKPKEDVFERLAKELPYKRR